MEIHLAFLPGESHGQRRLVQASVHGVIKSWTWLSTHTHVHIHKKSSMDYMMPANIGGSQLLIHSTILNYSLLRNIFTYTFRNNVQPGIWASPWLVKLTHKTSCHKYIWKSLLMKVKEESDKLAWNSTFKKLRSWHLVPLLHGK